MLKVYSVIYRIILVLALLFSFAAKVIVGTAGHNPDSGISDYIFIAYCLITVITLTIYAKRKSGQLRQALRTANVLLVLAGVFTACYIVYMMISEGDFIFQLIIPLALFIIVALMLFLGLIKDKP